MPQIFDDRVAAGQALGAALAEIGPEAALVVGIARGGVVVGYGVARKLGCALRALVVRKIRAPANPELALGAVSASGVQWLDLQIVRATNANEDYLAREITTQIAECKRQNTEFGNAAVLDNCAEKSVIIVDDGIATGASALVAVRSVRYAGASKVILAAPVASRQSVQELTPFVDALTVLDVPDAFMAVGYHYREFQQVSDAQVLEILRVAGSQTDT